MAGKGPTIKNALKIVTRKSPLAWQQATLIKNLIQQFYPQIQIELIGLLTAGDQKPAKETAAIAGKSLFVKELQTALLNLEADFAVHSVKDLSVTPCPGLMLAAISAREDPRDVFVSNQYNSLEELPMGAIVGTTSPRRQCQLLALRKDLNIKPLRGNVGTRLNYLDNGDYQAIVLAYAGLKRLGLQHKVRQVFPTNQFLPAIGQGALAVECREDNLELIQLLNCIDDYPTHQCVNAERAVNFHLGGDCYTPIGAYAYIQQGILYLHAMAGSLDGKKILKSQASGPVGEAEQLGERCAKDLLTQGAHSLIF